MEELEIVLRGQKALDYINMLNSNNNNNNNSNKVKEPKTVDKTVISPKALSDKSILDSEVLEFKPKEKKKSNNYKQVSNTYIAKHSNNEPYNTRYMTGKLWLADEETIVKLAVGKVDERWSVKDIARSLKRTESSVRAKAISMGYKIRKGMIRYKNEMETL